MAAPCPTTRGLAGGGREYPQQISVSVKMHHYPLPTIAKGKPGELSTQSASPRCALGLYFNVLVTGVEFEGPCKEEPRLFSSQLPLLSSPKGSRYMHVAPARFIRN